MDPIEIESCMIGLFRIKILGIGSRELELIAKVQPRRKLSDLLYSPRLRLLLVSRTPSSFPNFLSRSRISFINNCRSDSRGAIWFASTATRALSVTRLDNADLRPSDLDEAKLPTLALVISAAAILGVSETVLNCRLDTGADAKDGDVV